MLNATIYALDMAAAGGTRYAAISRNG